LFDAIRGGGAFRRFKDKIYYLGIEQDWYDFKEKSLMRIAKEWCTGNGLVFEE
jgi:hypothetical protein